MAEAIQQVDAKVPSDFGSVKSKINNLVGVIQFFTESDLGTLGDALKNFISGINTAIDIGVSYPQIANSIHQVIEDYFDKVRREWDERSSAGYDSWIFRSQITAAILTVQGVANVQTLKLNGAEADVQLKLNNNVQELPMLGEVNVL